MVDSAGVGASFIGRRFTTLCFLFFPRDLPLLMAAPETDGELLEGFNAGLDDEVAPPLIASPLSEKVYVCGPAVGVPGGSTDPLLSHNTEFPPPEAHARNTASEIDGVKTASVL
jgi:hypothetical protein